MHPQTTRNIASSQEAPLPGLELHLAQEAPAEPSAVELLQKRLATLADQLPQHYADINDLKAIADALPGCEEDIGTGVEEVVKEHNGNHKSAVSFSEESFDRFTEESQKRAADGSDAIRTDVATHFDLEDNSELGKEVEDHASERARTVAKLLPKNFRKRVITEGYEANDQPDHPLDKEVAKEAVREEFFQTFDVELSNLESEAELLFSYEGVGKVALIKSKLFPPPSWAQGYSYSTRIAPIIRRLKEMVSNNGIRSAVQQSSWYQEEVSSCEEGFTPYRHLVSTTVNEAYGQLSEHKLLGYVVSKLDESGYQATAKHTGQNKREAQTHPQPPTLDREVRGEFRSLATRIGGKKALRELAKQHHPDKGGDEEKFKVVSDLIAERNETTKKLKAQK